MVDRDALTGLIYDAALDNTLWPTVLESLCDAIGGDSAALLFQNQIDKSGTGLTVRLDPSALSGYYGEYRSSPLHRRNDLAQLRASARFSTLTDRAIVERSELERTAYFNEFLRPAGIHSSLMMGLLLQGDSVATLNLMRGPARDEFDESDIGLAETLRPHLARASKLSIRLGAVGRTQDALLDHLERAPYGVILIASGGLLRHANRAATALLRQADGLVFDDGCIAARNGAGRALAQTIGRALSEGIGGALALPRPGRHALDVLVTPMHSSRTLFAPEALAMLCITDPEADVVLPDARLREMFGLTDAEAGVALDLLAGYNVRGVAARRGISFNTVRVHLARILDKTGTNRQVELIKLLMQIGGMNAN